MLIDNEMLNVIFNKTDGRCHICRKNLAFSNYGDYSFRGAWHIDHSVPKSQGGSDRLTNLLPACIPCNLEKGTRSTRTARRWHGQTRAPLSFERKQEKQTINILLCCVAGLGIGKLIGGPWAIIGGISGLTLGTMLPVE